MTVALHVAHACIQLQDLHWLLWRDKTCPARTWLIMSWKALLFFIFIFVLLFLLFIVIIIIIIIYTGATACTYSATATIDMVTFTKLRIDTKYDCLFTLPIYQTITVVGR